MEVDTEEDKGAGSSDKFGLWSPPLRHTRSALGREQSGFVLLLSAVVMNLKASFQVYTLLSVLFVTRFRQMWYKCIYSFIGQQRMHTEHDMEQQTAS